ncbi:unknown [Tannerella sp. CAG:118]|nr:unknown [Tannerella sp. CAG:118]
MFIFALIEVVKEYIYISYEKTYYVVISKNVIIKIPCHH